MIFAIVQMSDDRCLNQFKDNRNGEDKNIFNRQFKII